MTAIVELKNATKVITNGFDEEKSFLNDVSLEIFEHDFITILGWWKWSREVNAF